MINDKTTVKINDEAIGSVRATLNLYEKAKSRAEAHITRMNAFCEVKRYDLAEAELERARSALSVARTVVHRAAELVEDVNLVVTEEVK